MNLCAIETAATVHAVGDEILRLWKQGATLGVFLLLAWYIYCRHKQPVLKCKFKKGEDE